MASKARIGPKVRAELKEELVSSRIIDLLEKLENFLEKHRKL